MMNRHRMAEVVEEECHHDPEFMLKGAYYYYYN